MYGEFEHLTSVLRVFNNNEKYGDQYWGVTVRWINKEEIEIMLQQKKITVKIWKAIIEVCRKEKIKRILAVTYPNGSNGDPKRKWIEVN